MKFEKIKTLSNEFNHAYNVSHDKRILVFTYGDHSITSIMLLNLKLKTKVTFEPRGLWYLENITEGDECEYLNPDSLMIMIAQEEHGCVRA